jgi:intracellular multiplication protein IcmD
MKNPVRSTSLKPLLSLSVYFGTLIALFCVSNFAIAGGESLGDVAGEVTKSMSNIAILITSASYVAGVGFALMGMLKFKAHKDQPQQVPLSQPIVLLCIAAGLVFLPSFIKTAGQTIFKGGTAADATGKGGATLGGS